MHQTDHEARRTRIAARADRLRRKGDLAAAGRLFQLAGEAATIRDLKDATRG